MKGRFKEGDRVRVVKALDRDANPFLNKSGVVIKIGLFMLDFPYAVEFKNKKQDFAEEELEFDSIEIFNQLIDEYYGEKN